MFLEFITNFTFYFSAFCSYCLEHPPVELSSDAPVEFPESFPYLPNTFPKVFDYDRFALFNERVFSDKRLFLGRRSFSDDLVFTLHLQGAIWPETQVKNVFLKTGVRYWFYKNRPVSNSQELFTSSPFYKPFLKTCREQHALLSDATGVPSFFISPKLADCRRFKIPADSLWTYYEICKGLNLSPKDTYMGLSLGGYDAFWLHFHPNDCSQEYMITLNLAKWQRLFQGETLENLQEGMAFIQAASLPFKGLMDLETFLTHWTFYSLLALGPAKFVPIECFSDITSRLLDLEMILLIHKEYSLDATVIDLDKLYSQVSLHLTSDFSGSTRRDFLKVLFSGQEFPEKAFKALINPTSYLDMSLCIAADINHQVLGEHFDYENLCNHWSLNIKMFKVSTTPNFSPKSDRWTSQELIHYEHNLKVLESYKRWGFTEADVLLIIAEAEASLPVVNTTSTSLALEAKLANRL